MTRQDILRLIFVLFLNFASHAVWSGPFVTAADLGSSRGRGFNLQTALLSDRDVSDMATMGARIGRFHLEATRCGLCYEYEVRDEDLKRLDQILAYGKRSNVALIIVLDPIPRGHKADFWDDEKAKGSLIKIWRNLAKKYATDTTVAAYDLLNEPDPQQGSPEGNRKWIPLATRMIEAIRAEDKNHAIVFEPAPIASAFGFEGVVPFSDKNIVYSFHFYEPHRLTHQGLLGFPVGLQYPGLVGLRGYWDKDRLSEYMEPARRFQKKFNVPLQVGEFSFIRWAPGKSRYRYLSDSISLFDKEGWGWLYHSFREWDGWDLELPPDDRFSKKRTSGTAELELIKDKFK